jgi:hypothetical protein
MNTVRVHLNVLSGLLAAVVLGAGSLPVWAQDDVAGCKTTIVGALAGDAPMPAPMPMPELKAGEPMPTGMAKETDMKGDVGPKAAMQDKCMDAILSKEQSDMDKKK